MALAGLLDLHTLRTGLIAEPAQQIQRQGRADRERELFYGGVKGGNRSLSAQSGLQVVVLDNVREQGRTHYQHTAGEDAEKNSPDEDVRQGIIRRCQQPGQHH